MKKEDIRKKDNEDFNKILPSISLLLKKMSLTNKVERYAFNGNELLMRLNGDIVEMALASEATIFPTLAFRKLSETKSELMYYRVSSDFDTTIFRAVGNY